MNYKVDDFTEMTAIAAILVADRGDICLVKQGAAGDRKLGDGDGDGEVAVPLNVGDLITAAGSHKTNHYWATVIAHVIPDGQPPWSPVRPAGRDARSRWPTALLPRRPNA